MNLACVTACSTWWTSPVLAGLLQEILLYKLPAWEFRVPWALQSASPANKIKQGSLSSTCFNNIVTQSSAIRIWTVCLFSFLVEQEAWLAGLRKSFFELAERNQGNQGECDRIFQLSECHGLSLWENTQHLATLGAHKCLSTQAWPRANKSSLLGWSCTGPHCKKRFPTVSTFTSQVPCAMRHSGKSYKKCQYHCS